MRDAGVIEDGAVLVSGGKVVAVGTTRELRADAWVKKHLRKIEEVDGDGTLTQYVYNRLSQIIKTVRYADRLTSATLAGLVDAQGNPTNVTSLVGSVPNPQTHLRRVLPALQRAFSAQTTPYARLMSEIEPLMPCSGTDQGETTS